MNFSKPILIAFFSLCVSSPIYASEEVLIEGGDFEMGSLYCEEEQNNSDWCNDESPHKVKVDSNVHRLVFRPWLHIPILPRLVIDSPAIYNRLVLPPKL